MTYGHSAAKKLLGGKKKVILFGQTLNLSGLSLPQEAASFYGRMTFSWRTLLERAIAAVRDFLSLHDVLWFWQIFNMISKTQINNVILIKLFWLILSSLYDAAVLTSGPHLICCTPSCCVTINISNTANNSKLFIMGGRKKCSNNTEALLKDVYC